MKKRLLLILTVLSLLLAAFAVPVFATEIDETEEATPAVREPGQCGEEMYWAYEDGTLTITGKGEMDDYSEDAPWAEYQKEITEVIFDGEISYIGANAFRDYDALETVDFGDAVYEIGLGAFYSCDGLTSISLPSTFKIFGEDSFRSCKNLKEIHCQGRFPSFRLNSMWDTYVTIYFSVENPWPVGTIAELEEAFKGRIEFLASDGSDPYEPTEPTEETTEPEETTEATEAATEATEVTTEATQEVTQPQTQPMETEAPETTVPETEVTEPEEPEQKSGGGGIWIAIVIIVGILGAVGLGEVIFSAKRARGGRYSGKYSR